MNSCLTLVNVEQIITKNTHLRTELDDEILVMKAQSGSREAFNELVRRYMRRAYSLAYQIVGDMETARDISQDVFLKIYQSLDQFKPGNKFFSWFYRILTNHCINYRRRKKIVTWLSLSDNNSYHEAERASEISHDEDTASNEDDAARELHKVIGRLPNKQRMVVLLHGIEGLSQKETADILGISEGTVRSRFFYARDRLRTMMKGKMKVE